MQQLQFGPTGWLGYSCFVCFFNCIDSQAFQYDRFKTALLFFLVVIVLFFYFILLWVASLIRFFYSASNQYNRLHVTLTFKNIQRTHCSLLFTVLKVSGSDTEGLTVGTIGGIRLWLDVRFAWHLNTSYRIYKRYDNRNCSSISAICSHAKCIQHLIQHTAEIAQSACSHYRLR